MPTFIFQQHNWVKSFFDGAFPFVLSLHSKVLSYHFFSYSKLRKWLLSLMIYRAFFLLPVHEGGAYNLKISINQHHNPGFYFVVLFFKEISWNVCAIYSEVKIHKKQRALRNFESDCKMHPICTKFHGLQRRANAHFVLWQKNDSRGRP